MQPPKVGQRSGVASGWSLPRLAAATLSDAAEHGTVKKPGSLGLKLRRRWRLGIRSRLWLLVLALGLPFLSYLALNAARESAIERERAGQQLRAAAELTAARLDDHIGDMRQVLGTLSHVLSADAGSTEHNDAILRSIKPQLPQHVNNVTVWTRAGENIGSLDPRLRAAPFSIADRAYFQAALQSRGLVAEAPIVSRSNGESIAVLAFPLIDDDQVVGVVAASTRLNRLQALLDPKGDLPKATVITVINVDGVILARSIEPQRWIGKSVPSPVGFKGRLQEGTGVTEITSIDGKDRVFGFARDRLGRSGAAVKNLAHSASFHSREKIAPSKPGTKHLDDATPLEASRFRARASSP